MKKKVSKPTNKKMKAQQVKQKPKPPSKKNELTKKESKTQPKQNKESEIACYAVRKSLGLRISSNRVEKANDLIVAERQKGKGMSWSRQGSWSLANITTMYLNHEADQWHKEGTISYQMYDCYGQLFVPQAS